LKLKTSFACGSHRKKTIPPKRACSFTLFLFSPICIPYPICDAIGGVRVFQEAQEFLAVCVHIFFRSAESNVYGLCTVFLVPERSLSVGESALWVRLTGPRFADQVAAVVSLLDSPTGHFKAAAVAKEAMAIRYHQQTSLSIKCFSRRP
jgi:hypothetical protein